MIRNPAVLCTPVWPLPRSLAATWRIDVSFSSWGYLDVSVHPVPFSQPIDSAEDTCALPQVRSRIRRSVDITDMCSSPQLIAACHVLLRLPVPRHPPYALLRLAFLLVFRSFGCVTLLSLVGYVLMYAPSSLSRVPCQTSEILRRLVLLPYMALMYGLLVNKPQFIALGFSVEIVDIPDIIFTC